MARTTKDERKLRDFAIEAARLLADRRCEDVQLIDVRGVSQVCDFLLVATGTSDRQMKSVSAELEDLGESHDHAPFRANRDAAGTWVVIDFIDLVAHIFEPSQREFYALEDLWSDGQQVSWQREDGEERRS